MSEINSDVLKGFLEVDMIKDNKILASLRHRLNSDPDPITGTTFEGRWITDCWDLKNGIAEKIPHTYSKKDFKEENDGISFLAYFPVKDFHLLLKSYREEIRQRKSVVRKERISNFFRNIRSRFTGLEKVTVSFGHGEASFSTPEHPLRSAEEQLKSKKLTMEELYNRMNQSFEEFGEPYMIIQRGFGLADSFHEGGNRVEFILLGRKEPTADLVDRLKENPNTAPIILTGMFRPGSPGVDYEAQINRNMEADPSYSNLKNGRYNPFKRVKETRIFDYRE